MFNESDETKRKLDMAFLFSDPLLMKDRGKIVPFP
jgi:hypothetical protein